MREHPQQLVVRQISGRNLVGRHSIALERVHADCVPGRTQRLQTPSATVIESTKQVVVRELESTQQVERVLGAEVFSRVVASDVAVQGRHVPHLELRTVGAGFDGQVDQAERFLETAIVIVADLRDHECGSSLVDEALADADTAPQFPPQGDRPEMMALVHERKEIHALEFGGDLRAARIDTAHARTRINDVGDIHVEAVRALRDQPAIEITRRQRTDETTVVVGAQQHPQLLPIKLLQRFLQRSPCAHEIRR